MTWLTRVGLLKERLDLFGGFKFRDMGLYCVSGMAFLLDAYAEILETLRLYPTDQDERPLQMARG